jgi:DNA-binding FrmR family transcriptional regulator
VDEVQEQIISRLKTAEGHLQAVTRMAAAGEPCEDILHQLSAVEAALHATGCLLLRCRLQESIDLIANSPGVKERTVELERLTALCDLAVRRPARRQRYE